MRDNQRRDIGGQNPLTRQLAEQRILSVDMHRRGGAVQAENSFGVVLEMIGIAGIP